VLHAIDRDEPYDAGEYQRLAREAVAAACHKQLECGIDVVSDGEQSKIGYSSYPRQRLTGFVPKQLPLIVPPDYAEVPEYAQAVFEAGNAPNFVQSVCAGPISWHGDDAVNADIDYFTAALEGTNAVEGFMPAASPGVISGFQPNEYFKTDEEYLFALAEGMKPEFDAIVAAGFVLQVDCPDLALGKHVFMVGASDAEFLKRSELHVEALNHALRDIPADRVRMHLCWGNYNGPHHHDIEVSEIIPTVLKAKPCGISFEGANPRHEHEWETWAQAKIPDDKVLIPGVIDSVSNFVEHPQLIANRIKNYAGIVGRERVLASSDCGFGTFTGLHFTHPAIAWLKLKGLAEGAALASSQLW